MKLKCTSDIPIYLERPFEKTLNKIFEAGEQKYFSETVSQTKLPKIFFEIIEKICEQKKQAKGQDVLIICINCPVEGDGKKVSHRKTGLA